MSFTGLRSATGIKLFEGPNKAEIPGRWDSDSRETLSHGNLGKTGKLGLSSEENLWNVLHEEFERSGNALCCRSPRPRVTILNLHLPLSEFVPF